MFTITITETPDTPQGEQLTLTNDPLPAPPVPVEVFKASRPTLDMKALVDLIWRTPRKPRADKGQVRAIK